MLIYGGNPWKQNLTSGYNCVQRERFKGTSIFKVGTHFMPAETSRKKRKRNWKENFKFGWHLSGSVQYFTNPQFQPNFNRVCVWDIMSMTCTDWARDGNMRAFRSECRLKKTTFNFGDERRIHFIDSARNGQRRCLCVQRDALIIRHNTHPVWRATLKWHMGRFPTTIFSPI